MKQMEDFMLTYDMIVIGFGKASKNWPKTVLGKKVVKSLPSMSWKNTMGKR